MDRLKNRYKKYRVTNKRKSSYKLTYSIYDFYKTYPDKIDKNIFINVCKDMLVGFTDEIIYKRKRIAFPFIGLIRIKRVLSKKGRKRIDPKLSKELNQIVYYTKLHSNSKTFIWKWDKSEMNSRNKSIYEFVPSQKSNDKLGAEIIRCSKDPYSKDYDALS